ncbi:MAG TPA: molybdopterin-dependent oxidoreductase [Pyrinomonadaceae bacterium]|nr:molybdopterin-dependent oxidoreductase [Acidobacteriota bacterium]HQZ94675.1 molybdopterin-dependent oxidoreductase [Pyrinomonadaceae bacterium]
MSKDIDKEILVEKVREFERRTGHTVDSFPDDPQNTASILGEHRYLSEPMSVEDAKKEMSARSRRYFLSIGATTLLGIIGWRSLSDETKDLLFKSKDRLLLKTFEFNESVSQFFFRPTKLAPEFPPEQVTPIRTNGFEGLEQEIDVAAWTLTVAGLAGRVDDLVITMADIKKLPRTEMITEFKCIEGWSTIVHWAGVKFSDFAAVYKPKTTSGAPPDVAGKPEDLLPYVAMSTPDEKYYVGWDMPSIMHPQTLLAYEMNGEPLRPENGAPLRIASPTKYGIKQIKRLGRIEFTSERPKDFWAEYGYDWYSGH